MVYVVKVKKSYTKLAFRFKEGRKALAFVETFKRSYVPNNEDALEIFIEIDELEDEEEGEMEE